MKHLRIAIYLTLLLTTTLIPSKHLTSKPIQAIFKSTTYSASRTDEPPLSGSFVSIPELDTIEVSTLVVEAGQADATSSGVVSNCGSDPYQILIYTRESGCSTTALNSKGCYGLGQDCNNLVRSLCGSDWTCQNDYFTSYMQNRYGSWQAGWQHELDWGWW